MPITGLAALTHAQLETWISQVRANLQLGQLPTYIPQLTKVDPEKFALHICDRQGRAFSFGDVTHLFVLMSVMKPFLLLFLLEQLGTIAVFQQVGTLPSDQAFNSLEQLQADGGFPRNPMLNSGAIVLASLLPGQTGEMRCHTFCQWLNQLAGSQFTLNRAILASVREGKGISNRKLAQYLHQTGHLTDIELALDTYNHLCCLAGTITDLAALGMLLAKPHPAIHSTHQQIVNAIMTFAGLYQASSSFAMKVGLPTKSGVSGAVLAIVPKQGVIASYSPSLDEAGNSRLGLALLEKISHQLSLNLFS